MVLFKCEPCCRGWSHDIPHPSQAQKQCVGRPYGERELSCLCGASSSNLLAACRVPAVRTFFCPLSLPPRQPSYYLCTIEPQGTVLGFLYQLEIGWKSCWRFGPECSGLFQDELRQDFQLVSSWYRRTLYRSCNSQIRGPRFTEASMLCLKCETRMNRLSSHTRNTKG